MEIEYKKNIERALLLHGVFVLLFLLVVSFFSSGDLFLSLGAALGVVYAKLTLWLFYSVVRSLVSETQKNLLAFVLIPLKLPIVLLVLYGLYLMNSQLVLGFVVGLGVLVTAPLSAAFQSQDH